MSLAVKSLSPSLIADANLPIALRPTVSFPPAGCSIFDDPGDEKSWHVSQRSEGLTRFFDGRESSWYASAIAPLGGAERVLDLGCGPGLTLEALLDQGCTSVLGIDRWPAFTANSTRAAPIIAHDLTLPIPFLKSGSFDGVLSHYALDYVSPVGMRQVLREAYRVLAPGGRLVIYVAAVGLGSGDPARTVAYSPPALRTLLLEAGFDEIDVEASANGRNSVAKASRSAGGSDSDQAGPEEVRTSIEGDTQLSGSFSGDSDTVEFELLSPGHRVILALGLPPSTSPEESRVSVCARVLRSASAGTELQLWAWRGCVPVASECARLEFGVTEARINCAGGVEHVSAWSPGELSVEPLGNAHVRVGDLPTGGDLSEAERGAEGRQVVVEAPQDQGIDAADRLGPGRNRFLVRRASGVAVSAIDRDWLAGRVHGIVLAASELGGERMRELLLWASWRQALVLLSGSDWESVLSVASQRETELRSPVVLVDPALSGDGPASPLPPDVAAFIVASSQFFVLLSGASRACSDRSGLERLSRRILHGGPPVDDGIGMKEANEALRYLTERTLLMRLRQAYGHSPAEVGRRQALS